MNQRCRFLIVLSMGALLSCSLTAVNVLPGESRELIASGIAAGKADKSGAKSAPSQARPAADKDKADADKSKTASAPEESSHLPVIDPSNFGGLAAIGYASAKQIPEICSKLFCYCGCDITDNHSSLLDCYTSMHGVDCHICQEEATLALRLHRDGVAMAEIQKQVDEGYQNRYPFQQPSPALRKYIASRLWGPKNTEAAQTVTGPAGPPVVKPGFKVTDCCKDKEHHNEAGGGASSEKKSK